MLPSFIDDHDHGALLAAKASAHVSTVYRTALSLPITMSINIISHAINRVITKSRRQLKLIALRMFNRGLPVNPSTLSSVSL